MSNQKPERYVEWKKLLALFIEDGIPPYVMYDIVKDMDGQSEEMCELLASIARGKLEHGIAMRKEQKAEKISKP